MLDQLNQLNGSTATMKATLDHLLLQAVVEVSATSSTFANNSSTTTTATNNNNDNNITNQTHCPLDSNQPQQMYVQLSTFWYCFLALITSVGLLVSLVSNMIIIYLFTSTASLRRNPSNIIAANLSLSDLLYCLQWPSVIYCSLTQSTWILEYESVCQSFGFITLSTALASILTVMAMSVERAIVIMYSMQARKRFTNRWAWSIIVLIWIMSLSSAIPPLFGGFNRYTLDPSKTSCTLDYLTRQSNYKLYILVLYGAYWIAPTVVITISYILIITTFKKSSLSLKSLNSDYDSGSGQTRFTPTSFQGTAMKTRNSNTVPIYNAPMRSQYQPESRRLSFSFKEPGGSRQSKPRNSEPLDRDPSSSALLYKLIHGENSPCPSPSEPTSCSDGQVADKLKRQERSQKASPRSGSKFRFTGKARHLRCLTSTSLEVRQSANQSQSIHAHNSQTTRTALQFRLAKMSFYLILLWLVSWTPIASLAMINAVRKCHKASAVAVFISSTMTKLGPTFDVFIYGISHPKTKSKFKHLIKWPFTLRRSLPELNTRTSFLHSVPLEALRSTTRTPTYN